MGQLNGQYEIFDDQSANEQASSAVFTFSDTTIQISEVSQSLQEAHFGTPKTACATPEITYLTSSQPPIFLPPLQLPQASLLNPSALIKEQSLSLTIPSDSTLKIENSTPSQSDIREYYTLLSEQSTEEIVSRYQNAVKSNSIKTILYHFIKFMKYTGDDIIIEALSSSYDKPISHIRKEFQSFIKQKCLNQQTFIALFHSLRFRSHLEYYLKYYSLDTIIINSVKDPMIHVLCLVFFQKCFNDKSLLDAIKTYKKKI